eukprot:CAMPEP_0179982116 /NCGR_PEP_ID=MMETSP0983-20121128/42901_1 /TAXON_ID=483367 /ORGANISM="non described non described, Strain CCMP 2436" /LENGTH=231 /DNA_ID=CAMNT_0021900309 /DNA_START=969 /DNA_END=1666 /DNA_ORIENTATION=-
MEAAVGRKSLTARSMTGKPLLCAAKTSPKLPAPSFEAAGAKFDSVDNTGKRAGADLHSCSVEYEGDVARNCAERVGHAGKAKGRRREIARQLARDASPRRSQASWKQLHQVRRLDGPLRHDATLVGEEAPEADHAHAVLSYRTQFACAVLANDMSIAHRQEGVCSDRCRPIGQDPDVLRVLVVQVGDGDIALELHQGVRRAQQVGHVYTDDSAEGSCAVRRDEAARRASGE